MKFTNKTGIPDEEILEQIRKSNPDIDIEELMKRGSFKTVTATKRVVSEHVAKNGETVKREETYTVNGNPVDAETFERKTDLQSVGEEFVDRDTIENRNDYYNVNKEATDEDIYGSRNNYYNLNGKLVDGNGNDYHAAEEKDDRRNRTEDSYKRVDTSKRKRNVGGLFVQIIVAAIVTLVVLGCMFLKAGTM